MNKIVNKSIWGLKCPECKSDVEWRKDRAYCVGCGREVCDDDIEEKKKYE